MNVGKQILFADNDPAGLKIHQDRLQRDGYALQSVTDGIAALKMISGSMPDLVVLDLRLPKLNGSEVFKFMRLEPRLKNVPVILFTHGNSIEWPKNVPQGPIRCVPERASAFPLLPELIQEMLETGPAAESGAPAMDGPKPAFSIESSAPVDAPAEISLSETAGENTIPRAQFLKDALQELPKLHEHYMLYLRGPTTPGGQQNLGELRAYIDRFRLDAAKTGCPHVELLAKSMSELLKDLAGKPARSTPSLSQTLAQAFDCLRCLLNNDEDFHSQPVAVPKVLCVDDDEICNQVALSALERINAEAESADTADAALERLQTRQYDLALLDINMPGQNGFQLCEQLRAIPHCQNMPVIFITAFNNFDNRKQSVLNGAEDFITKPVYAYELALKVTICLFKKRPSQNLEDARKEIEMLSAAIGEPAPLAAKFINNSETKVETTTFTKAAFAKTGTPLAGAPTVTATLPPAEEEVVKEPAFAMAHTAVAAARPAPITEKVSANGLSSSAVPRPVPAPTPSIATPKQNDAPPSNLKLAPTESLTTKAPAPNESRPMKIEKNARFEMLVNEVSQLIFGTTATDLNQRLVRMALEQTCKDGAAPQSFETVAAQVARLIFGDTNTSELNVRLVRMALERVYSEQQAAAR